jgi:hypothetical protein
MADAVEEAPELRGRSSPSPAASPEFQFWMVGENPSPALLTADELFSGGVVLPLHNLQVGGDEAAAVEAPDSADPAEAEEAAAPAQPPLAESGIAPTPDLPAVTFKWKDIFKANNGGGEAKERKKAERRVSGGGGNAELININIWPFSRSRSAGHGAAVALSKAKPTPAANASASGNGVASNVTAPAARKVSSAPCSRSNSRGESGPEPPPAIPAAATVEAAVGGQAAPSPAGPTSMLRRLVPGHHGRSNTGGGTGIRLGRPSPVWQLRRNKLQQAATEQKQAGAKKKAAAAAGLAPAPSPAGAATASDAKAAAAAAANGCRKNAEGGEEGPSPPQGLLGLRTFFSKKVY